MGEALAATRAPLTTEKTGQRWFVIETAVAKEVTAWVAITELGIGTFYPQLRKIVKHARKKTEVLRPMFPGYLFAQFDPQREQWISILSARGVKRILGHRGADGETIPQPVPQGLVEFLRGYVLGLDEAGGVRLGTTMGEGTEVQMIDGAFAGFAGLVDKDEGKRIWVLLDILGKSNRVSAPREAVTAKAS